MIEVVPVATTIVIPDGAAPARKKRLDWIEFLMDQVKDSVADVMADRVEDAVWKSPDLSGQDLLDQLPELPAVIEEKVAERLSGLGQAAGAPSPATALVADVTARMVLKPVSGLRPVLEVAYIAIGVLTGNGALALAGAKLLVHDEVGKAMACSFEHLMSLPEGVSMVSGSDAADADGLGGISLSAEGREALRQAHDLSNSSSRPEATVADSTDRVTEIGGCLSGGMSSAR